MDRATSDNRSTAAATLGRPCELELADGTRLIPETDAGLARVEGDANHAFTLADVQRSGREPFQGYRLVSPPQSF